MRCCRISPSGCGVATIAFAGLLVFGAVRAEASPISLSAVLTGDGRAGNPDNLHILVSIVGDTTSNVTDWVVDLAMDPDHPSAALHEFYFNLVGASADYAVHDFTPAGWSLSATDVGNANGSGNTSFMFENEGPNNTVTNSVNLTFKVTKDTGLFAVNDFLLATSSCSNDVDLGCGQIGAHVGSLHAAQGESDSGFALGGYAAGPSLPEPALLVMLGIGLLITARRYRRLP